MSMNFISPTAFFVTHPRPAAANSRHTPAPSSHPSRPTVLVGHYSTQGFEATGSFASVEYFLSVLRGGDLGVAPYPVVGWARNDGDVPDRFSYDSREAKFMLREDLDGFTGPSGIGTVEVSATNGVVEIPDGSGVQVRFNPSTSGDDLTADTFVAGVLLTGRLKSQDVFSLLSLPTGPLGLQIGSRTLVQQEDFVVDPETKFIVFTEKRTMNGVAPLRIPAFQVQSSGIIEPHLAPTSVSVVVGGVPQTLDENFIVNYGGGVVTLVDRLTGPSAVPLTDVIFMQDQSQLPSFSATLNGTPIPYDRMTLNPKRGWLNIDHPPTVEGDVLEVSYLDADEQPVVDTFTVQEDGESAFTLSKAPVHFPVLRIEPGDNGFLLLGDQAANWTPGILGRVGAQPFQVSGVGLVLVPGEPTATQVTITGQFGEQFLNPPLFRTDAAPTMIADTLGAARATRGQAEVVLPGVDRTVEYKPSMVVRLGVDFYQVRGVQFVGGDTKLVLTTNLVRTYPAGTVVHRYPFVIPGEGDVEVALPRFSVPTEPFTLWRNGPTGWFPVAEDVDLEADRVLLPEALQAGDEYRLEYTAVRNMEPGTPFSATVVVQHRLTGPDVGSPLFATMRYMTPDEFYVRVTSERNHIDQDLKPRMEDEIRRLSGQVGQGKPVAPDPTEHWQLGMGTDLTRLGQAEEDDWVVGKIQRFLHERVTAFETERMYLNGVVVGGEDGFVEQSEFDKGPFSTTRIFPALRPPPTTPMARMLGLHLHPDVKVFSPTATTSSLGPLMDYGALDDTQRTYPARIPALQGLPLTDIGLATGAVADPHIGGTGWGEYRERVEDEIDALTALEPASWGPKPYWLHQESIPANREPYFQGPREAASEPTGAYLGVEFGQFGRWYLEFTAPSLYSVKYLGTGPGSLVSSVQIGHGTVGQQTLIHATANAAGVYARFTLDQKSPTAYQAGDVVAMGNIVRFNAPGAFNICTAENTGDDNLPSGTPFIPYPIRAYALTKAIDERATVNISAGNLTGNRTVAMTSSQASNEDSAGNPTFGFFTIDGASFNGIVTVGGFVDAGTIRFFTPSTHGAHQLTPAPGMRPRRGSGNHALWLASLQSPPRADDINAAIALVDAQIDEIEKEQFWEGQSVTGTSLGIDFTAARIESDARLQILQDFRDSLVFERDVGVPFSLSVGGRFEVGLFGPVDRATRRSQAEDALARIVAEETSVTGRVSEINNHLNELYDKRFQWLNFRVNRMYGTTTRLRAVRMELAMKAAQSQEMSGMLGSL